MGRSMERMVAFKKDLLDLINRHSIDSELNTPDFVIANYLCRCLYPVQQLVKRRDQWFGFKPFEINPDLSEPHQPEDAGE